MLRNVLLVVSWAYCFQWCNAQSLSVQFQQLDMDRGLSHNHVTAILKDSKGFMWFGTSAGLNRYDGHQVKVFRHFPKDSRSLLDNGILALFTGPDSRIWVKTQLGYNVYNSEKECFIRNADSLLMEMGIPTGDILDIQSDTTGRYYFFLHGNGQLYRYDVRRKEAMAFENRQSDHSLTGMTLSMDGSIWLVYQNGFLQEIDISTLKLRSSRSLYPEAKETPADYQLMVDGDGDLWIYSKNLPTGVYWWPKPQKTPIPFHTKSQPKLNNNFVTNITQDSDGRIWLATDHGGVNLYDKQTGEITYLTYNEFNSRSLAHNSTTSLYQDHEGIIWIGTFKGGISYYHKDMIQFPVYRHQHGDPGSLPYDDVNRFVEDRLGNLWIGTNGGGLLYFDRYNNQYRQYLHDPGDVNSLGSNVVVSLYLDKENILWVGTYHGGLNRFDGHRFIRYMHDPSDPASISDNSVWEIYEDSSGRFWIGTLSGGLNLMDRGTGSFTRLGYAEEGGPHSAYISAITEDSQGNIWFGTATGIDVLENTTGKYRHLSYQPNAESSLSNDYVTDIFQDSRRRMWISTHDGLNLYRPETDDFHSIRMENGLPDNSILTILEDVEGNIWVSTGRGLSAIYRTNGEPQTWYFRNYDRQDGLQATAFNENAALRTASGELVFGGPSGFNIINPSGVPHNHPLPQPVLTDFQLFNRSIAVDETIGKRIVLPASPSQTQKITLPHNQNVLSLVVASLHFIHRDRVAFRYQLEGFGEEWLNMDRESRKATFTNLDPGNYRFKVIVSTDNEMWSEEYTLAEITIMPPFWKTGWAYAGYVLLITGGLLFMRHIERLRERTRYALRQEQEEYRRIRELDRMKTRFFTNVSHEFRTPISLILAPLDKLSRSTTDLAVKQHLELMQRNAKRLLNLVNQLLDFRKIDAQRLQLNLQAGDITAAIGQHCDSFLDMAADKQIDYRVTLPAEPLHAVFDHDKLEHILLNLLSNAFKFTHPGGKVSIDVSFTPAHAVKQEREMTIVVQDTGIGIPIENQTRIFDRYFQHDTPTSMLIQGSGIGLAIVKEYTQLLNGKITVNSVPNEGSTFTVVIPLMVELDADKTVAEAVNKAQSVSQAAPVVAPKTGAAGTVQRVLLVEDDEDFRFYLKGNLKEHFAVQEAKDAEEGWTQALAFHPDIIVSDVSMPGDDGVAYCIRLKNDNRTKHIPLILLTAVADEEVELAGIKAGAADYITKPFDFELLLSKMSSLLKQKDSMERTFRKQLDIQTEVKPAASTDELFMRKAMEVIERKMGEAHFSVEELAGEMNVSRVGLYKRILTLTGYTPSGFIRSRRLRKAAHLLAHSGKTVAEVAYEVGFNSPKAFSRYFKDLYGVLPSVYRKENES